MNMKHFIFVILYVLLTISFCISMKRHPPDSVILAPSIPPHPSELHSEGEKALDHDLAASSESTIEYFPVDLLIEILSKNSQKGFYQYPEFCKTCLVSKRFQNAALRVPLWNLVQQRLQQWKSFARILNEKK